MTNNQNSNQNPSTHQDKNGQRPENKDNLDSRKSTEQIEKGSDVTHNKKDKKSKKK